jgi:hypothetical protein
MYYNRMQGTDTKTAKEFTCWQKVDDGSVSYVDAQDQPFKLPKVYEAEIVEADLERPE